MSAKTISIIAVSLAVVSGSVAAVWVSVNRTETARLLREAAASKEAAADANRKAEAKKVDAAAEQRRAAEAEAEAKKTELAAKGKEVEANKAEAEAQASRLKIKEAERATAEAQSQTAIANREAAAANERAKRNERDAALAQAQAEALKAQAAADALATEKLKSEKVIAESKLIEQRQIDFSTWQRELLELQRDLEEREAAIKPEKTIADLAWAGGVEDSVIDENGNIKKQVREPYNPEKDHSLPVTTRKLARQERLIREAEDAHAKRVREKVVAALEKLYTDAIRDKDVIFADYYRESIKTLYPDWKFKGEEAK